MHRYKVTYVVKTEFDADDEKQAAELNMKNLHAIICNCKTALQQVKIEENVYASDGSGPIEWSNTYLYEDNIMKLKKHKELN